LETQSLLEQLGQCVANCTAVALKAARRGAAITAQCDIQPSEYIGDGGAAGRTISAGGHCATGKSIMLSRGMYAFPLYWLQTQFARQQILVLSMHEAVSLPPSAYLKQVLDFLGFPADAQYPLAQDLGHSNSASDAQKSDLLDDAVRDELATVYAPWNEVLYAMEPQLQRFPPP